MKFNFFKRSAKGMQNYEGAKAYKLTPEVELYSAVVASSLSDTFYEKADQRLARIQELIANNRPEFVAQLAVYARKQMHLRSVPMVLAVELAKHHRGDNLVSKTVNGVVRRADEITELLAYYQLANARTGNKKLNKISKQIQKGLAVSFNGFDEYQFAKYNRNTDVKLRDALFLVHPKAKDEAQQLLFNKIAKDELAVPYTWEVELSRIGQEKFDTQEDRLNAFKAKWEELIDSNRLGYMALLRNLRNIIDYKVSASHMEKVCMMLSNPKAVSESKQLPFRFLAAYRELKQVDSIYSTMVLDALERAVTISANNITGFDVNTKVVIACDVSASMQKSVSLKSKIHLYDIGLMLAMLLQSRCKAVMSGMFGDTWKVMRMPSRNILANVDEFYKREGEVGYSTNGYKVIEDLRRRRQVVDKVMMFTDCQMWNSNHLTNGNIQDSWKAYKKMAPEAKLYMFDLAGYGNTPLSIQRDDVFLIAGWSDKVFDVLQALENSSSAVDVIRKTEL
jgi:60 kDa SS-A/Ro ribonucleoprotein